MKFVFNFLISAIFIIFSIGVNAVTITGAAISPDMAENIATLPEDWAMFVLKSRKLERMIVDSKVVTHNYTPPAIGYFGEITLSGAINTHLSSNADDLGISEITLDPDIIRGNSKVPEPSSLLLFTLGLFGLSLIRRQQK